MQHFLKPCFGKCMNLDLFLNVWKVRDRRQGLQFWFFWQNQFGRDSRVMNGWAELLLKCRTIRQLLAGGVLAISLPTVGLAQSAGIYSTVITQPVAEVRASPSTDAKIYTTNRLRMGEPVVVLEERNDNWLAIRPPRGSFSWVQAKHLKQVTPGHPNWVVIAPPGTRVPALVGSSIDPSVRPSVEGTALIFGTQVRAVGEPTGEGEGRWIPIDPPESERRYIAKDAVAKPMGSVGMTTSGGTNFPAPVYSPNPTASAPPAMVGNVAPITPGAAALVNATTPPAGAPGASQGVGMASNLCGQQLYDPALRWNEAYSTELARNYPEAIRLYTQLAQDFAATQPELATQASNRAIRLREATQVPGSPLPYPDRPIIRAYAPSGNQAYGVAAGVAPLPIGAAPGQTASSIRLAQPFVPQGSTVSASNNNGTAQPISPGGGSSAVVGAPGTIPSGAGSLGPTGGTGVLRRSGRNLENRQMYLLESNGKLLGYVVPVPPLDLESFVDKPVDVRGGMRYVSAIRANVLYATAGNAWR